MIDLLNIEVVILDHSYCKPDKFEPELSTVLEDQLQNMADSFLDWKDEIGVAFDPPSETDAPLSSLSPSHSVDSGFDNEMNFLTNLADIDLDSILNSDTMANTLKQTPKTSLTSQPSTSKISYKAKTKVDVMTDAEKSKKNAIAARENRIKKKKYIESIEGELQKLRKENEILKAKEKRHDQVVDKLNEEISYLKNVLVNQSTLSTLVNRLVTTPGLKFNLAPEGPPTPQTDKHDDSTETSDDPNDEEVNVEVCESQLAKGNVHTANQTRYQTRGTKRKATTTQPTMASNQKKSRKSIKGGVCLHLGQNMVSLTFCSQCSSNVDGNTGN